MEFAQYANRILILDKGKFIASGTYDYLKSHPLLQQLSHPKDHHSESEIIYEDKSFLSTHGTKITQDEEEEILVVQPSTYVKYFKESYLWITYFGLVIPLVLLWNWVWMSLMRWPPMWIQH